MCDLPSPTPNQCGVSVGSDFELIDVCLIRTFSNEPGIEGCKEMSDKGEWIWNRDKNGYCYSSSCAYGVNLTGAGRFLPFICGKKLCIGFSDGGTTTCKRISFQGDPIKCCFNNYICNNDNSLCFSDSAQQATCADGNNGQPNYRDLTGEDCQDVLFDYCTGKGDDTTDWLNRWTINNGGKESCIYALKANLVNEPCFDPEKLPKPPDGLCNFSPDFPINSQGYFWAQKVISAAMEKYSRQGFELGTLPGTNGYNIWQDFMYTNVCCPYPGLCQSGIKQACSNKIGQRISYNPGIAQWCGCHLPTDEYEDYSVKFNIPIECTPLCNRVGTIPLVGINAEPITCKQNICMIDNVTVNLINAQIGGGVNFNQVCGNCENSQCSCIVSNTTVDIINSTIGGNVIPINENCGSLTCSQTNPGTTGPATINIPCSEQGYNPYLEYDIRKAAKTQEAKKISWIWTLIVIGICLVLIYLIIIFINPNLYSTEGVKISREKPFNAKFQRDNSAFNSIESNTNTDLKYYKFIRNDEKFNSIE